MPKYNGNSAARGTYRKFDKVGDRHAGTLVGTQTVANKFNPGSGNLVATFKQEDGTQFKVRLSQEALVEAWMQAAPQPGEYVILLFEKVYDTRFGAGRGKEISVEIPSRDAGVAAAPRPLVPAMSVAPAPAAAPASEYDRLAQLLREKVGAAADPMLNALAQLYSDPGVRLGQLKIALIAQGVAV